MDFLTETQLQTLQKMLSEREAVLRAEVRGAKQSEADRAAADAPLVKDLGDEGEERIRTGVAHVELQRDQQELLEIAAAFERMRDGYYGQCINCGREIRYERLLVQPMALRCIDCQTNYEKTHPAVLRFAE